MAIARDRGQMLLIGAIVLAVLFVSLSFVLNGSIQTTTFSAEASADVSVSETRALQDATRRDVARLMVLANQTYPDNPGQQKSYVQNNTTVLSHNYSQYYARQDRIVYVSYYDSKNNSDQITSVTVNITSKTSRVNYSAPINVTSGDVS